MWPDTAMELTNHSITIAVAKAHASMHACIGLEGGGGGWLVNTELSVVWLQKLSVLEVLCGCKARTYPTSCSGVVVLTVVMSWLLVDAVACAPPAPGCD